MSSSKTTVLFLAVAFCCIVTQLASTASNLYLQVPALGQCFSTAVADGDICAPTTCQHLFNSTPSEPGASVSPKPLSNGLLPYEHFRCNVITKQNYLPGSTCKVAQCQCIFDTASVCYPGELNGCAAHGPCPTS